MVVNRYPYYRYDNVYYQACPTGYVVVEPPAPQTIVVQQSPPPVPQTIVVQPSPPPPVAQTVVVPAPVALQPVAVPATPATPATSQYTVNIPNSDGTTYTAVVILSKGSGYVGPQGEFYTAFPRVEQLKAMYGK